MAEVIFSGVCGFNELELLKPVFVDLIHVAHDIGTPKFYSISISLPTDEKEKKNYLCDVSAEIDEYYGLTLTKKSDNHWSRDTRSDPIHTAIVGALGEDFEDFVDGAIEKMCKAKVNKISLTCTSRCCVSCKGEHTEKCKSGVEDWILLLEVN